MSADKRDKSVKKEKKFLNYESVEVLTGIQPDHHRSHLNNFEDRYEGKLFGILDAIASDVIEGKIAKRFIMLCGTPGCGKTHFLVGLFRAKVCKDTGLMGAEHSTYIQFPTLITDIIEGFSYSHSTRVGLMPYLAPKYLFIDDVSKGERVLDKDKMESQVFREILIDRFENKKVLIATSNYSASELKRMVLGTFGDYVLSRLDSSGLFVEFPKLDFRKGSK
jgi:DNA replication protein DnaC